MPGRNDDQDSDKAELTTPAISNEENINVSGLSEYFLAGYTLVECSEQFKCSVSMVRKCLRSAGVNSSERVKRSRPRKYTLSDTDLKRMFIDENLDTKTIAESQRLPVHYNIVRKHTKRLGLKKSRQAAARSMSARHLRRHGVRHPSQRPDVLARTRASMVKAQYCVRLGRQHCFRSLHELGYALLLDSLACEWYYEEMRIPYIDMITGKQRIYVIDFTVMTGDDVEWIEVKPAEGMIPDDKRIYASRRAEEAGVIYRGLTADERQQALSILSGPLSRVIFKQPKPRSHAKKITYYFVSEMAAHEYIMDGWRHTGTRRLGENLWAHTLVRSS